MKACEPMKGCRPDSIVSQVLDEFRATYADAVDANMTDAEFWRVEPIRRLVWKSDHRLSLPDAIRCYAQIDGSYNEFDPKLLVGLRQAFPNAGIEVTPAREYSVAVYLHVPDAPGLRKQVEFYVRNCFRADEVSWKDEGTLRCWWD